MNIRIATTDKEITKCFPVMAELRPHLSEDMFVQTVRRMIDTNNFGLAHLDDDGIKAVAGFRISEWLHTGKYLEIEDLVTAEGARSRGYGGILFDWLEEHARQQGCKQLRLVSGVAREDAHRFYLRKGMIFEAKYFSMMLG